MFKTNEKLDRKKIGICIYYTSIILVIFILLYTLIFVKNDDAEVLSKNRYMMCFYSFGGILSSGIILREFFIGEYILKKMIIKIAVTVGVLIAGTIVFIFVDVASIALLMMFASLLSLMFVLIPSVPKETNTIKK